MKKLNTNLLLLLSSICILRAPSFAIPFIPGVLSSGHNIVRLLIAIMVIKNRTQIFSSLKKIGTLNFVIGIWFLSQSLSILNVRELSSFFSQYKDLVFGLLLYAAVISIVNRKNVITVIWICIISTACNLTLQILVLVFPTFFLPILHNILYEKYSQSFFYQFDRSRFFGESLDETMVPLILVALLNSKRKMIKLPQLFIVLAISFVVIVSNWRTKTFLFLFALTTSIILLLKKSWKFIIVLLLVLGIIIYTSNIVSTAISNNSSLQRIFYSDDTDMQNVKSRFRFWHEALAIFYEYPIFGAGLRNYYINLPQVFKQQLLDSKLNFNTAFVVIDDPHNIFISSLTYSGILGFLSFTLLVGCFAYSDFVNRTKSSYLTAFILTFWSIFLFSLFNPSYNFGYIAFFWLIRGVIEKLKLESKKQPLILNKS